MYKIIVRPTCIIINDYDWNSCPRLENCFRIYNMTTHSYYYIGLYYDKENRQLYVMRGCDLWFVQKCFDAYDSDILYEEPDSYGVIDDIRMKLTPRDDIQKECLKFMLGLDNYKSNNMYSQLSVNLSTGKGKSYVSIYTIAYTKRKSIIVTYSVGWLKQWMGYLKEYTNLTDKNIHMIKGAGDITMLLSGKSRHVDDDVFLITHSSIKSYGDSYGWDKIRELFKLLKIGNLFIDEAHLNFDNICNLSFNINVYKTYFITATPKRSDQYEDQVYQLAMKNVPSIDLFDPDKDPHTDYVAIKWNSRPTPQDISNCRNIYGLARNAYINYVVNNENFYLFLHVIMDLIIKKGGRTLIYIGTNEAIVHVYHWICKWYPEFIGEIGIYTSIAENKKEEREKKIILSTTKSAGAAEDFVNLSCTVLLAEPFKSEVIARQTLGRTRNNNTIYIESVDLGFRKIKQFYYAKLPVFNKYALSTSDINLNQINLEEKAGAIMEKRERIMKQYPLKLCDYRFGYRDNPITFGPENEKHNPLYFF